GPMSPRVALLTPFAFPSVRGNAVTAARVAHGLRARGVEVDVWDLSLHPGVAVEAEVDAFRPAVVHAFHAYRAGPLALRQARRAEIPLVVTLTGTDANHDLFDPERASVVRRVLEGAARLTAFHDSIAERVAGALPDLRGRLVVVPQSSLVDTTEPFDLGARWDLPRDRDLFVFTGFHFRDEAEFERRAELLASDPALRARLGAAGRELITRRYPAAREIDGYIDVYRQLVPVSA